MLKYDESDYQEAAKWLYHLTVVSGGNPKAGTQFEQLVQKLMEEDGCATSSVWRNPLMVHSKEPIAAPLTTFTSERLQAEAVKLFKVSFSLEQRGTIYARFMK